ncbi:hypothetical protein ANN_12399 [Periplaneta americana]|uniref:Transposase Tc1-like domain-containing protein n=1 Tax=Periplaneta americana TaxID=6978 RepID=A0ABQ8TIL6_PERAM|nr:hypothetical protein ANN_12399 [Periplaneta americana]
MLGENPQTIRENAEILVEASKAIGLEVNPEKTKYMIMSRDQNIVRNGTIKIGDLSIEEVEKFKYLGATVTNLNDTREEIKRRINMGNACYYSVEKLLSSSLLSKSLKVRIYKTVILPVVLYGCETWTLTLREEQRLRVFENKVLRKISGAKRDEVTGEWRKLHNAELHALYTSPDIIRNIKSRRLRLAGHVARMDESRNAYRVLVGRPEGKIPLGRPRRRWEDNIKMDLRKVGYDGRDWINLAQDRDQWRAYVRAAMNLRLWFRYGDHRRANNAAQLALRVNKWSWLLYDVLRELQRSALAFYYYNMYDAIALGQSEQCRKYLFYLKALNLIGDYRLAKENEGLSLFTSAVVTEHERTTGLRSTKKRSKYRNESRVSAESYPTFAVNGFKENPGNNLNQVTCPNQDLNLGPSRSRSGMLTVTPEWWTILVLVHLHTSTHLRFSTALLSHAANAEVAFFNSASILTGQLSSATEKRYCKLLNSKCVKGRLDPSHPRKKGNCGRKRKTSPADDRLIVRKSKLNPRLTAVDLTRELMATTGANIHVTTVRRRLLEAGRRARKPIKKQLLTPVMCKKRLMWAKLHQHWTVNDWKNVLFSDESHFEVHGHHVSYVRKGSEKVTAAHLQQAPKYPPKEMF